jgi:ribonuclease VapC
MMRTGCQGDRGRHLGGGCHFSQESDAASYAQRIADDDQPLMSAANIVETSLVLRGLKRITSEQAERWLDEFLVAAGIRIEQVTTEHVQLARRAHIQFGKGTGHPARARS